MTNSIKNNGKNIIGNVVLAKFQGEEAKKLIAVLEAGHGFTFSAVEDEDGNPVVELIKDD